MGSRRAPQAEPQQSTHVRARAAGSPWRGGPRNRVERTQPGWGVCASEGVWGLEGWELGRASIRRDTARVCFGKLTLMRSRHGQ